MPAATSPADHACEPKPGRSISFPADDLRPSPYGWPGRKPVFYCWGDMQIPAAEARLDYRPPSSPCTPYSTPRLTPIRISMTRFPAHSMGTIGADHTAAQRGISPARLPGPDSQPDMCIAQPTQRSMRLYPLNQSSCFYSSRWATAYLGTKPT